jgi:predicted TIM-barrel fold metal-dependent hydrolase
MIKYANLRLMTSAWSPRRLPDALIQFLNTRGQERILFASDSPVLSITRCVGEATDLDLRPGVLDRYLYSNAESFFFDR